MKGGQAMDNRETQAARRYHQATRHSVLSVQTNRHYLDWDNQPSVYKTYRGVESIHLPVDLPETGVPALYVLEGTVSEGAGDSIPDLTRLAHLLYYTAGVTKKLQYPGGEIEFRAAAAAGALYPVEIYAVCGDLAGLPAGVYHFGPRDFALRKLRSGDYREFLARTSGEQVDISSAPLILVFTAITWRSSWKYQARAYRYHFWDCGTLLANCLASCSASSLPARVVLGFVDQDVSRLVGIDGEFEKSLALVPIGRTAQKPGPSPEVGDLDLQVEPLSADWRRYPLIDEMHQASRLDSPEEVAVWRRANLEDNGQDEVAWDPGEWSVGKTSLPEVGLEVGVEKSIEETILKRGSSRRFRRESLPATDLSVILKSATSGFRWDWEGPEGSLLNQIFLNVHAVGGLSPGSYQYLPAGGELALLREGSFRAESAHLCLGQALGGDSSATVFFMADLERILERYGNRGYRAVQLEAGILGGKMYLSAYALERGASGLTFFDDDVISFFSPAANGLETTFVTALGISARSPQRGGKMIYLGPGRR
jgi:SagB-type dehydrogenase family enzyme